MTYILTLVASYEPLNKTILSSVLDQAWDWLSLGKAAACRLDVQPDMAAVRGICDPLKIDVFVSTAENKRKKLLVADMDSTIVAEETLDELAGFAGIKDKISEITTRAMNGDLDFHEAIRARVALLKDLSQSALDKALAETTLNQGAGVLVRTMKAHGALCVLVSGGFTVFTEAIAAQVGFDHHHGNQLGLAQGKLTGQVIEPILDKEAKVQYLEHYLEQVGLSAQSAMTIGDGANDLPMLLAAQEAGGLGVGYYAKESVAAKLTNVIRYGDLSAGLYAQGYYEDEFIWPSS